MTSARGRKRRPQRGRRPQHGRRQKSRGRRSLAKQRKHRGQAKRQLKKQRKRASKSSFHPIRAKTLNQIKRDGWFLSHQAKGLMISFVEDIYKQVSSEAERLRRKRRDPLVSPMHVQAALQRLVPKRWRRVPTLVLRNRH